MSYFAQLLQQSWSDTWRIVVQNSMESLIVAGAIFATTAWAHYKWRGHDALREKIFDVGVGLMATLVVLFLVFLANFLFFTPKKLVEASQQNLADSERQWLELREKLGNSESRIKLDIAGVSDVEAREKLVRAEKRLRELEPLNQSINSAVATATVEVLTPHFEGNVLGAGGFVAFGERNSVLLHGSSMELFGEEIEKGKAARYRIVCPAPVDSPYMGKPIRSLLAANYMQIDFVAGIESGTQILGGTVVWVLNNSITLTFRVPPQKALDSHIFIRELGGGFQALKETSY